MKKPAGIRPTLFDDLLGPASSSPVGLNLSAAALKDLATLERQMRKADGGEEIPRLDAGKAVRVVVFLTRTKCLCGAVFESPLHTFAPKEAGDEQTKSLQCAMLKRVFHGSTLRAIYSPLPNHEAFQHLPHDIEVREEHVINCPHCFQQPHKVAELAPAVQQLCCIYCRGAHELCNCKAEGHHEYEQVLVQEAREAKQAKGDTANEPI